MKRIINTFIDILILLSSLIIPFVILKINNVELILFNVIWICFYLSLLLSFMFNLTTLFYLPYFKKLNKKEVIILMVSTLIVTFLPYINCLFIFFDKGYIFIAVVIINFVLIVLHMMLFIYLKSKNNSLLLKECNNNKC